MNNKELIITEIERISSTLKELSLNIYNNPELGFNEYKAVGWICEILKENGFSIDSGIGGLETAFRASIKGNKKGPVIALIAEYDALNGLGHGCGHNLIASASVGAALGLKNFIDDIDGELLVIGTPAEEGGGGKIKLIEKGIFQDVDYALMFHPSTYSMIGRGGLAATDMTVEYFGKSAHSAAPEEGINALSAVISLFNGIDVLKAASKPSVKINGIITNGGNASNIVPDYSRAEFTIRSKKIRDLEETVNKIRQIVTAGELINGTKSKIHIREYYAERYPNLTMGEQFKGNMRLLGEDMIYPDPMEILGSSDIGNVSLLMPIIHSYLKIADSNVYGHSIEFTQASGSPEAQDMMIKAAKGLAMTVSDIFTNKTLQKEIYREFNETVKNPSTKERVKV